MDRRIATGLGIAALGLATLAFAQNANPPRTLPPALTSPAAGQAEPPPIQPVSGTKDATAAAKTPPRLQQLDLNKLNDLQKQLVHATQRATVWLARMHGKNGRFVPGWLPDLKAELEADHFLRQAGAAFALARAARFSGEAKLAALATETVLSLVDETAYDAKLQVRFTPLPSAAVNRLGAAGLLVAAINELPEPKADLLAKSEELCAYIRFQVRPDGWLSATDTPTDKPPTAGDEMQTYPGMALFGLQLSQRHKPAPWKAAVLKNAVAYYLPWWRANKSLAFVPWQTAAYAEAFVATRDAAFAQAVVEMNDWLAGLPYSQPDPRHPLWFGGFPTVEGGKVVETPPTAATALYAGSLVEACRVARHQGDGGRFDRYRETADRALQFLATLQYTDATTQHFEVGYRPRVVGGFYGSHQDGTLRLENTQQALSALLLYLDQVVLR